MIRAFLLGGTMMIALAAPASAQDQCVAPGAPAIPDGARATPNRMAAVQSNIKAFAAAADNYQNCLAQELGRQKALAQQGNRGLDPNIQAALDAKGEAQRKDVGRVAAAWGATVEAFNKSQERKRQSGSRSPPAMGGGGYGGGTGY